MTLVVVSGGFDPLHVGHVRMIRDAREHGLVCIFLNSDEWLMRKKEYVFMCAEERAEVLHALEGVHKVHHVKDSGDTICEDLRDLRTENPSEALVFANGGDRKDSNVPEVETCKEYNIQMIWNVGGSKVQSSSDLVENTNGCTNRSSTWRFKSNPHQQ